MIRPADPGALLLFVVEPQQLDAVHEFGTEILSPDSIIAGYACPVCETDEHTADEHDALAALDEDTDRYEDT
jgi:hypothetical protein